MLVLYYIFFSITRLYKVIQILMVLDIEKAKLINKILVIRNWNCNKMMTNNINNHAPH